MGCAEASVAESMAAAAAVKRSVLILILLSFWAIPAPYV
jgi:hypothetical protein